MGSQLLQNTEIIKQLTYYFGKSEENTDLSRIYLAEVSGDLSRILSDKQGK